MRLSSIATFLLFTIATPICGAQVRQDTKGDCANAIAYVSGNVTILCGSQRKALQPLVNALKTFERRTKANHHEMRVMVEQTNRALMALLEGLSRAWSTVSERDNTISERDQTIQRLSASLTSSVNRASDSTQFTQDISDWQKRYEELLNHWKTVQGEDKQSKRAFRLITENRLAEAASMLKEVLEVQEKQAVVRAGRTAYRAAQASDLLYRFGDAEHLFKRAHQLVPNNTQYLFAYSRFLLRQGSYARAITVNEEALDGTLQFGGGLENQERRATILNMLGMLYRDNHRLNDGENAFVAAQEILRRLVNIDPFAFEGDLADVLDHLGLLYADLARFNEAEKIQTEALNIYRRLSAADPGSYEHDLGVCLNNLGLTYGSLQRFKDAESAFKETLHIRRQLAAANPPRYESYLGETLVNLGTLYRLRQRPDEAEAVHVEARDLYRRLVSVNPASYEPFLATTLNHLAAVYGEARRSNEAMKTLEEAHEIYRKLVIKNPRVYEPHLAYVLINSGRISHESRNYVDAEVKYLEAAKLLRPYVSQKEQLRLVLRRLIDIYSTTNEPQRTTQFTQELEALDKP